MARNTGTFEFPSNFEVKKSAPLDARTQTGLKSELTGLPFAYKGMIVSVTDDTDDNNGTYVLNDADGSLLNNWSKIASTTVTDLDYTGNLLTLTMSDGSTVTAIINTSQSSVTAPSGEVGVSTVNTSVVINNVPVVGTLKFNSNSGQ